MFKIFMSEEQKNRRKWCPRCGKMYDLNTKLARCWDCSVGLVSYEEYKNRDMEQVEKEYQKAQDDWNELERSWAAQRAAKPVNRPTCPTCGSTNVEKISAAAKVGGAAMFGLLSKTARSQFKCKNCGYKW